MPDDAQVSLRTAVGAAAGLAAAWIAADSLGLVAPPLRHALAWIALGAVILAAWPGWPKAWAHRLALLGAGAAALLLAASQLAVVNVLAVSLVLGALARASAGADRRVLRLTALAVLTLAVYRLALLAIPTVWIWAEAAGRGLGGLGAVLSGEPLAVGPSFAGLDFLVMMAVLYAGWFRGTAPRPARAALVLAAIVLGHLAYLVVLAHADDLRAALPVPPPAPEPDPYVPPDWQWSNAVRVLLPWNVPVLAAAIHVLIAGFMLRWGAWRPEGRRPLPVPSDWLPAIDGAAAWGPMALAVLIPLLGSLWLGGASLANKKIVAFDLGHLDWHKPVHDRYGRESAGMYGMLPMLVGSLGGTFAHSPELAAGDLTGADVLVLIHPDRPFTPPQREAIWGFVRRGGSLLVVAEPWLRQQGRESCFNELLAPMGMEVATDTAIPHAEHWQDSLDVAAHPAALGYDDRFRAFGTATGSSIRLRWPARPLVVGRWGWSDPGSDAVHTGVYALDRGERLGDLVLAAECRVGWGTVVVVADASGLNNEGLPDAYPLAGRLLAYLAAHADGPQALWRQGLGLLACVLLVALLAWRPEAGPAAAASVLLAGMFWVCLAAGAWTSRVLPDGRSATPNPVAYLDASHLEGASSDPWRSDGLAGLKLTLMRNGYLPLSLYELTPERLQRAGLLISIAPARGFSWTERPAVDYFVNKGGIFICTVGADQAQAVNPLLEQFELRVRAAPAPPEEKLGEPMSLGFFRSAHLDAKGNRVDVLFYAGWPVDCSAEPWEQDLLESLLWRPKLVAAARKQVVPVQFVFDPYRRIYAAACRLDEAGTLPTPERLQAEFTEQPMRDLIGELYRGGLARGISDRQMEDISEAIEASRLVSSDVLVRRFDEEPLVVVRYLGQGKAALVADGGFALNKNLEMADGEPIDGGRENALFWRWFLTYLNGQPQWFPPKPPSAPAPQSPAGEVQP